MYRLRAWEADDADRVLDAFTDPELALQESRVPGTRGQALEWIAHRAELVVGRDVHGFAVVEEEGGSPLGHVQVAVTNQRHGWGWVSYWTHHAARGRGIATAGARLISDLAFSQLGLFRLEMGHRLDNPGSCLAARRAGFRPEGVERAKLRYGDRRYDTGAHARLATDPVEGIPDEPCRPR